MLLHRPTADTTVGPRPAPAFRAGARPRPDRPPGTGRRLAMATIGDSRDVRFWSGTPRHMAEALAAADLAVEHVGPLKAPLFGPMKAYARLRAMSGLGRPSPYHAGPVIRQYAEDAARRIREAAPDLVFAPAGSAFAGKVPAEVPLVYASDATFRLVDRYHPHYRDTPEGARRLMERLERDAIGRADLLLYPSAWAARSAVEDYGADPDRVHVVPWGANLARPPDRELALAERRPGPWRLLFVGVDWEKKGADTAVDALGRLRAGGIEAELVVCGCRPPAAFEAEGVMIVPFVDKTDPAGRARFERLFLDADLFVLPTRADCYGIAFCEAAAFGVPSVAPATGGVPGAVTDGETGVLVPDGAGGEAYADAIAAILSDPDGLERLRRTSRDAFETRLNWNSWARRFVELASGLP